MEFKSINPYTGKVIDTHNHHTTKEIDKILQESEKTFDSWKNVAIPKRCELMQQAAQLLEKNIDTYAKMITMEMGKPVTEARAEVRKCAWVCEFYSVNAERFLADEIIETDADESFISFDPLGTIFGIMPWNFPFWQVFRFAVPTLLAGNAAILKHAQNVFGCAKLIENLFKEAGFPEGLFQNLFIHHDIAEQVINNDIIKAVTLTGSERAGSSVAMHSGKAIKKTVLELGGSNAFIVCEDADMDQAVQTGVTARMMNTGQSCIAAKRFILVGSAYDSFLPRFLSSIKELKAGDPLHDSTQIGPLARTDLAENLERQINKSVDMGAELITGGKRDKSFIEPTVLDNVNPGMPAFDEETFGPLAAIIK
jgi:succinate-semialdehyde dehydrogenase / glutarate-semialdehyde dehydrogenase